MESIAYGQTKYHGKVNITCLPIDFLTIQKLSKKESLSICDAPVEYWLWFVFKRWFDSAQKNCSKSCEIINYSGVSKSMVGYIQNQKKIWIEFEIKSDNFETYEEYFVYNFYDVVGSVGGTLGLFIGLSFIDLLKRLMKSLKTYTLKCCI